MTSQLVERQCRGRPDFEVEMHAADQPHQVLVAVLVLSQQSQPIDRQQLAGGCNAALLLAPDGEVDADDRLDAGLGRVLREFERAEQVVAVGDGDRRHPRLLGQRDDLVDLVRAFGERIGGTNFQMDEISDGHAPLWLPHLVENEARIRGRPQSF
jgi:hypothetical protein